MQCGTVDSIGSTGVSTLGRKDIFMGNERWISVKAKAHIMASVLALTIFPLVGQARMRAALVLMYARAEKRKRVLGVPYVP